MNKKNVLYIKDLNKIIRIDPELWEAYRYRGEILKEEGVLKTEVCLWYKKKLAAHHGTLSLTPQRLTFKQTPFMLILL